MSISPREMSAANYLHMKQLLLESGDTARHMLARAQRPVPSPATPDHVALEVCWAVLCAGRIASGSRFIEARLHVALATGRTNSLAQIVGSRRKAEAVGTIWEQRLRLFASFEEVLAAANPLVALDWAIEVPGVGHATCNRLLKALGVEVLEPNTWLCCLAGVRAAHRLSYRDRFARCQDFGCRIASATGDAVRVVDAVLWGSHRSGLLARAGWCSTTPAVTTAARTTA